MREILFRGKRADTGEWVYGSFIPDLLEVYQGDKNLDGYIKPYGKTREERLMTAVLRETVGQYTGLADKNGVKIFEGDILLIGDSKNPVLVEFVNFSWECTNKNIGPYYRHRLEDSTTKYEVIGNVHDNPRICWLGAIMADYFWEVGRWS